MTGLRYNIFKSDKTFQNLAPRFSAKYHITDKINLKAASGIYYQYLHCVPRFIVADIWSTSNKYQAESKSTHYIFGYQQEIAKDYEFEAEVFYKIYDRTAEPDPFFQPLVFETAVSKKSHRITVLPGIR